MSQGLRRSLVTLDGHLGSIKIVTVWSMTLPHTPNSGPLMSEPDQEDKGVSLTRFPVLHLSDWLWLCFTLKLSPSSLWKELALTFCSSGAREDKKSQCSLFLCVCVGGVVYSSQCCWYLLSLCFYEVMGRERECHLDPKIRNSLAQGHSEEKS